MYRFVSVRELQYLAGALTTESEAYHMRDILRERNLNPWAILGTVEWVDARLAAVVRASERAA